MAKRYAVPPAPVLEVVVQAYIDPERDQLRLRVFRTVGIFEAQQVYSDHCLAPVAEKVLAEMSDAIDTCIRSEIMFRWGIQEELGLAE